MSPRLKMFSIGLLSLALLPMGILSDVKSSTLATDGYDIKIETSTNTATNCKEIITAIKKVGEVAKAASVVRVQNSPKSTKQVSTATSVAPVKPKQGQSSTTSKSTSTKKSDKTTTKTSTKSSASKSLGKISISSIGINASIVTVGRTSANKVDTPKNDVGWFNESAKPGSRGAVFLDGHTPGVFGGLNRIAVGAIITLSMSDGSKLDYVVKHTETVALSKIDGSYMANKVLVPYGGAYEGLNIMTCANGSSSRFIVYTVRK